MEKNKIIWLLITIVALLLIIISILVFKSSNNFFSKPVEPTTQNNSFSNQVFSETVSDPDKIPNTVTGIVLEVKADKIIIKQFASSNLNYVINKSDIGKIVVLKINPDFNKDKAELYMKEQSEKAKGINNNNIETLNEATPSTNPALIPYTEDTINWENIPLEATVDIQKSEDGIKKLTVYPKEANIGPPTNESQ